MATSDILQDKYYQKLRRNVFPPNWKNPKPSGIYDLVVIGGGPGGMSAAMMAARKNAKVAIVEKEHFGGECFNVGCIPSKALLRSSRVAAEVRNASEYGIEVPMGWKVNFPAVMERVRRLQSELSPGDSPEELEKFGIDVFLGMGSFGCPDTVKVGKEVLNFKKAFIATGTEPIRLSIVGLEETGYLTNQNVFQLTSLPLRLAVIGAGPIGCELSQAFARFGSEVTLITRGTTLLPRDDPDACIRLKKVMEKEGMRILFQSQVERVEKKGNEKVLYLEKGGKKIIVDEILVAIGRTPAVNGLDLEKAGVIFDPKIGVAVNDNLQTSNPNIYAVGDVSWHYKFTHVSKVLAKMAVHNALEGANEKRSSLVIPWCTYTQPEIAYVGLQEMDIKTKKLPVQTMTIELKNTDRAFLDGEAEGFVKIHIKEGSQEIAGATIMATHAGDMISEIAVAMSSKKGIGALAGAIHPFPTQAEALRSAAVELVDQLSQKEPSSRKRKAS